MTLKERQELLKTITIIISSLPVDDAVNTQTEAKPSRRVELLSIKECTKAVEGLSECTLRQLVAQNKIPYIRSGAGKRGKILISKAALLDYFGGKQ